RHDEKGQYVEVVAGISGRQARPEGRACCVSGSALQCTVPCCGPVTHQWNSFQDAVTAGGKELDKRSFVPPLRFARMILRDDQPMIFRLRTAQCLAAAI